MNRLLTKHMFLRGCGIALLGVVSLSVSAQTSDQVEVRRGRVVYVSGQDLVVKLEDGTVKHLVVPNDVVFNIDGKQLRVQDLKPGMQLTQTITTTTTNKTVSNVRTVNATVWQVNAPYLIVTLPDGKNKQVKVPDGTKFTVDGEQKTVFDLRPGMKLSGTIVTKTPETLVSRVSSVSGTAPPPPKPATPVMVGVLLVEEVDMPAPPPAAKIAPTTMASAAAPSPAQEARPATLPKTASPVPLIGLLGVLSLSSGLLLRFARQRM